MHTMHISVCDPRLLSSDQTLMRFLQIRSVTLCILASARSIALSLSSNASTDQLQKQAANRGQLYITDLD